MNRWDHPVSREWLALKTLIDNGVAAKTQRRAQLKTLIEPWLRKRFGKATRSQKSIRAALAARAPKTEVTR